MTAANTVRAYSYLAGVFKNQQQHDPLCKGCKAFVNSVVNARERLASWEIGNAGDIANLPAELRQLLADARLVLAALVLPRDVPGQKRAGNCKLPQGVCFIKSSLAMLEKMESTAQNPV